MISSEKAEQFRPCVTCGVPYSEDLFYHYRRDSKPFANCKVCRRAQENEYRRTPKGVGSRLLEGCKKRSKNVTIDEEWIMDRLEKGVCEVTGLPLNLSNKGKRRGPFTPSIDQKIPGVGYTKENCQLVCWIYNISKCDWSHDDVMAFVTALASRSSRSQMAA